MKFLEKQLFSRAACLFLGVQCLITTVYAQEATLEESKKAPTTQEAALQKVKDSIEVKPIGEGKYRIGKVTLDKKARTVTFPVKVNMREGIVEYVLVTEGGKAHESIFTTSTRPTDIHIACLLLGLKKFTSTQWPESYEKLPDAHRLKVEVTWPTNGPEKRIPLANFVITTNPNTEGSDSEPLSQGPWFYNGSFFRSSNFEAESEGSIISIIADGESLINGLRHGRENDELHAANKSLLPALGKTVKMVFTIPVIAEKK